MPHHKDHEKLQRLKEAVASADRLSEKERQEALAKIEEWYAQDRAFGTLVAALAERFRGLEPLLAELGLL